MRKISFVAIAVVAVSAFSAHAQDKLPDFVNAFAGDWVSYEPSASAGGRCALSLEKDVSGANFKAEGTNCAGDLANVGAWGIADEQLALFSGDGGVAARLGGNQNRISGTLKSGAEIVLERQPLADRVHQQWAALKCIYEGYSTKCADDGAAAPQAGNGDLSNVSILVKLNARVEPRPDAEVVGVLPPQACVPAQECVTASEGPWCKVKAGDKEGWISKHAIRLSKFPIATFKNGCSLPTN